MMNIPIALRKLSVRGQNNDIANFIMGLMTHPWFACAISHNVLSKKVWGPLNMVSVSCWSMDT